MPISARRSREKKDSAWRTTLVDGLGVRYVVTGKVFSSDERQDKERRVQYFMFIQVLEVETSHFKGPRAFGSSAARKHWCTSPATQHAA